MIIMNAPPKVKQKQRGYCYAACIMSLDNLWGGGWNQESKDIGEKGRVNTLANTKVVVTDITKTLSGIKTCIDGGNYALVHTKQGKDEHWVIAYSATAATEAGIMVMDPVVGNYITLYASMEIEKYHTIADVRKVNKR